MRFSLTAYGITGKPLKSREFEGALNFETCRMPRRFSQSTLDCTISKETSSHNNRISHSHQSRSKKNAPSSSFLIGGAVLQMQASKEKRSRQSTPAVVWNFCPPTLRITWSSLLTKSEAASFSNLFQKFTRMFGEEQISAGSNELQFSRCARTYETSSTHV